MRQLSSALSAILRSKPNSLVVADLFTITLSNGVVLRWTTGLTGLVVNGNSWVVGPPITRGKVKWSMGLNVDQLQLTILDDGSTTINGTPLVKAAWQNMFDLATIQVDRFISNSWQNLSVGTVFYFLGTAGEIAIEGKKIDLTIDSALAVLKTTFPKTYVLPSCANTLFDAVCQAPIANFTYPGAIYGNITPSSFSFGAGMPDGLFFNGKVQFTSGPNNGQIRQIKSYINEVVTLVYPLYTLPSAGDSVILYAGCDKTRGTCNGRFNNLIHYRGFPYVPNPAVQYSGVGTGAPESSSGNSNAGSISTQIGPRGTHDRIQQY
ncbi:MAG: DUF2163 domain-containing protein [Bryobacteraceae bacterium]